jgi:hypothetical protein
MPHAANAAHLPELKSGAPQLAAARKGVPAPARAGNSSKLFGVTASRPRYMLRPQRALMPASIIMMNTKASDNSANRTSATKYQQSLWKGSFSTVWIGAMHSWMELALREKQH